jgi:hypothetical protein
VNFQVHEFIHVAVVERRKMQKFFAQLFTYRLEKHVIVPPPVDRIDWTQGVPETR